MRSLDHVAICVTDIQKSIEWYQEKYEEVYEIYSDDTWGMIEIGRVKIALILEGSHSPHIAIRQNTSIPPEAKTHRDNSRYIYDTDPDGNVIERIWWPNGI